MVAGAETQQRRSPVTQMREHEFAARAVLHADRGPGLRIDELGMHDTPAPQMHAVLVLAFTPQRDADVADAHRLGDFGAPAFLEPGAHGGLAATRFSAGNH